MRCDMLAEGLVAAVQRAGGEGPIVIRMEGTNVETGKRMLQESGLNFTTAGRMDQAAALVVGTRALAAPRPRVNHWQFSSEQVHAPGRAGVDRPRRVPSTPSRPACNGTTVVGGVRPGKGPWTRRRGLADSSTRWPSRCRRPEPARLGDFRAAVPPRPTPSWRPSTPGLDLVGLHHQGIDPGHDTRLRTSSRASKTPRPRARNCPGVISTGPGEGRHHFPRPGVRQQGRVAHRVAFGNAWPLRGDRSLHAARPRQPDLYRHRRRPPSSGPSFGDVARASPGDVFHHWRLWRAHRSSVAQRGGRPLPPTSASRSSSVVSFIAEQTAPGQRTGTRGAITGGKGTAARMAAWLPPA